MKSLRLVIVFGGLVLLTSGCASTMNMPQGGVQPGFVFGEGVYPSMKDSHTQFQVRMEDVEVLGPVTAEGESMNVLLLFSQGDNGYQRLLAEAKRKYPETDALINMYWDTKFFNVGWPWPPLPVYQRTTSIVTATAVKFKKK